MNLATYTQDYPQQFFEFKNWQDAFRVYYQDYKLHGDNLQFVVSFNPYDSGYWIEKRGTELGSSARIYNHKKVIALKSRVKKEIALAEIEGRSPRFVS